MSQMSTSSSIVSFRGDNEASFDEAIDTLFRETQTNFNQIHMYVRMLGQAEDRNEDYIEMAKTHFSILDYIDSVNDSFKELKCVLKQVMGKCPTECKDEYQKLVETRKQEAENKKNEAKRLKELEKQTAKLEIK